MKSVVPPFLPPTLEKVLLIDRMLCEHYGAPFHFLRTKDPLSQMISSMLSHRTKNATTRAAFQQLRELFPTWELVRDAATSRVQDAIAKVTYPEVKAPRIQEALRIITQDNEGDLSLDFLAEMKVQAAIDWVSKLPGVGVKTSAAVLNFSTLSLPALVVDMHHLRVAQRLGIIPFKSTLDRGAKMLQSYIPEEWDGQRVFDSHQGFMRHGQKVCHWKTPNCKNCVVQSHCAYYEVKYS